TPCARADPLRGIRAPCTGAAATYERRAVPLCGNGPLGSEMAQLVYRRHHFSRTRSVAGILIHQQRIVRIGEVGGGSLVDLAVLFLGLVFLEAIAPLLHIGTIQRDDQILA